MKYSFAILNKPILKIDAKEWLINGQPFLVKDAFVAALNGKYPDEQPTQVNPAGSLTMETRNRRYNIMLKIMSVNENNGIDLSLSEVIELKECVGKAYKLPELMGFLDAVIEGRCMGVTAG